MLFAIETGAVAALSAAAAAGLAVGGYAYAAMWPTSQLLGKTLIAPRRPGELALTFDDGPNPAWTPRLLEILAAYDVKATFFMVGQFAEAEPQLVRRIAAAGHLIGNHSWNHPNFARTPKAEIDRQIDRTNATLQRITGEPVRFLRPPYGGRRPYALKAARRLGMTPVTWNVMGVDWKEPSAEKTAATLFAKIDANERRGFAANIVLHDGGHRNLGIYREPSVTAAGLLLERYTRTHKFVRLDAWTE